VLLVVPEALPAGTGRNRQDRDEGCLRKRERISGEDGCDLAVSIYAGSRGHKKREMRITKVQTGKEGIRKVGRMSIYAYEMEVSSEGYYMALAPGEAHSLVIRR
jgi:hypothetical protein